MSAEEKPLQAGLVTKEDFDLLYKVFVQEPLPELDIPQPDDPTWEYCTLSRLRPYDKNIHIRVMVIKRLYVNHTKDDHEVHELRVADATGCMTLVLWDSYGAAAKLGDILQINGGFVLMFQQTMRLGCKVGVVKRIGFANMHVQYSPNYSKLLWRPDDFAGLVPEEASLEDASINSDEERFYADRSRREPPLHLCHSIKIDLNTFINKSP